MDEEQKILGYATPSVGMRPAYSVAAVTALLCGLATPASRLLCEAVYGHNSLPSVVSPILLCVLGMNLGACAIRNVQKSQGTLVGNWIATLSIIICIAWLAFHVLVRNL